MEAHDRPDVDYVKIRDQIIDAINSLGVGVAVDPFESPTDAQDQVPMLAGVLAGTLAVTELTILPDDTESAQQWLTGFHYGVTGERGDTPQGAQFCLGAIASRLQLTWSITEAMSPHHPYAALSATLTKPAVVFAAAASQALETPHEDMELEPLNGYHRYARAALAKATAMLDSAEAWLRDNGLDIDTRN